MVNKNEMWAGKKGDSLFLQGSFSFSQQLFQKQVFQLFLQAPLSNPPFVDLTTHLQRNQPQPPPVATPSAGFYLLLSLLAILPDTKYIHFTLHAGMKRERVKEEGEDRRRWFSLIRGGSKKREWAFLDFLPSPGAGFFFFLIACMFLDFLRRIHTLILSHLLLFLHFVIVSFFSLFNIIVLFFQQSSLSYTMM